MIGHTPNELLFVTHIPKRQTEQLKPTHHEVNMVVSEAGQRQTVGRVEDLCAGPDHFPNLGVGSHGRDSIADHRQSLSRGVTSVSGPHPRSAENEIGLDASWRRATV
jgi:hypothetical protein